MGDGEKAPLRVQFNPKVCLEFHGATITSDAGLLPIRELDEALGLTDTADGYLQESRTGRNIRHHLIPLIRQSSTAAWPATTTPTMPNVLPKPGHASHRRLARLNGTCQHQRDGAL